MKRLYFVTGMPLAGKTTLAKKMGEYVPDAATISTGDIARKLIAAEKNPVAITEETAKNDKYHGEQALRDALVAAIDASPKFHIIVEGFPRDEDQLNWIKDKFWHYFPKIVVADVGGPQGSYDTLYNRARMRARDEVDRNPALLVMRLHKAANNIYGLAYKAKQAGLDVFTINTLLKDVDLLKQIAKVIIK